MADERLAKRERYDGNELLLSQGCQEGQVQEGQGGQGCDCDRDDQQVRALCDADM